MLSPIKTNLAQKLKDRNYRKRFFRGQAQDEIAYQLRRARKRRRLTQPELESVSGMKQSAISRIEQASYSKWNFQTLLKMADALDLRVRVNFDFAEDVIREYEREESRTVATEEFESEQKNFFGKNKSSEGGSPAPPQTPSDEEKAYSLSQEQTMGV